MAIIKENLVPLLIILVAGLVVSFAAIPLQNTEWAENIRTEVGAEGEDRADSADEGGPPNSALLVILPLIKVAVLMGIGGALTALVLWLIRSFKRFKLESTAESPNDPRSSRRVRSSLE